MEYRRGLDNLKDFGEIIQVRAVNGSRDSTVFLKHKPDDIDWRSVRVIKKDEYRSVFMKKQPACITTNIQTALIETGKCTPEMFKN